MKSRPLIFFVFMLIFVPAWGQTKASEQNKLDQIKKEIANIDKQLKANETKSSNAASQLTLTRKKLEAEKKLIDQINDDIAQIDSQIDMADGQLESATQNYDKLLQNYEAVIKKAYLCRDSRIWMAYLLNGDSFEQSARRYMYLKDLSDSMHDQALLIKSEREQIQRQKEVLDSLRSESAQLLSERKSQLGNLQASEKKEKSLVSQLEKDKAKYLKQLQEKKKQEEAINKKIAELIRKEAEAARKKNVEVKLSSDFAANKGKLPWPVSGTIVGRFGVHNHPVYTNVKLPFNNGINIATDKDEKARAVFDGTVKNVVVMPGYNQCVLVQHGSYYTFYCKLKNVTVKAEDKVKVGDVLGTVDNISGETQFHFQLWKETTPQDPEKWLR